MERYKLYMLQRPEDGVNILTGEIARYPLSLPVRLIEEGEGAVIVLEPHGDLVSFPKDAIGPGTGLEKAWSMYRHPERYRIYVDELREKLATTYVDWEVLGDLTPCIEAFKPFDALYKWWHDNHGKDVANAVFDIALHILIAPDELPQDHRELVDQAYCSLQAAEYMLTVKYFVRGLDWSEVFESENERR